MIAMMDGGDKISREKISQIVDAFYRWSHRPAKSLFEGEEAWRNAHKHVDSLQNKLKKQLSRGEENLILLNKEERDRLKESGVKILEHRSGHKAQTKSSKEDT